MQYGRKASYIPLFTSNYHGNPRHRMTHNCNIIKWNALKTDQSKKTAINTGKYIKHKRTQRNDSSYKNNEWKENKEYWQKTEEKTLLTWMAHEMKTTIRYVYIYIYIYTHAFYIPKGHSKLGTKNWKHLEQKGLMQTMNRNQWAVSQVNWMITFFSDGNFRVFHVCCSFMCFQSS